MSIRDASNVGDLKGERILLFFTAGWSEPSQHIANVLQQLASDLPSITVYKVEAEDADDLTEKFNVTSVPSCIFISGDLSIVDRLEGADVPTLTQKAQAFASGTKSVSSPALASSPPDINGRIKFLLSTYPVILFMKGSPDAPKCGFSGRTVEQLTKLDVPFHTVDILLDQPLRDGLKIYSDWPTYPQLYVGAELVGGCDIVQEMCGNGELRDLIRSKLGSNFGNKNAAKAEVPPTAAPESKESLEARIKSIINQSSVVLFMKGTPDAPRCGFSAKTCQALSSVDIRFSSFDILEDEGVRQGLKNISNWPTYPQLFVKGELVGGCDIVLEMKESGELKDILQDQLG